MDGSAEYTEDGESKKKNYGRGNFKDIPEKYQCNSILHYLHWLTMLLFTPWFSQVAIAASGDGGGPVVNVKLGLKEEEDTVRPVNFKGLAVRPCSNVFLSHKFLCSVLIWLVIYTVWDIYQLGSKVVHCSDRKHLNAVAQCNSITK